MKYTPFAVIQAAKANDIAAAEKIQRHFKGYIVSQCLRKAENGRKLPDEDARYFAETAMLAAIFTFQFKDPPDDFQP